MSGNAGVVMRALVAVMLAVGLLAGSAGSASAQEIVHGSTVPAGTTVDQDIILSGDDVRIDGTVLGDVIAVGGTVTVNGRVEGTLISVAQDVELNGVIGGSMFTAALQLLAGPEAAVGKNLYFGGLSLVLPAGAAVGRDLVAATLGATLGGEVGRDVRAIVGPFEFARVIIGAAEEGDWLGKAQAWWESVRPEPLPEPVPTVPPPSSSSGGGLMRMRPAPMLQATATPASVSVPPEAPGAPVAAQAPALEGLLTWLQDRLFAFLPLAFLGLVLLWLFPASLTHSADRLRRRPLPTWLWGFLVFVVANQAFVVAAILTVLIVVIGLAIGLQSMWGFAFSIWAIGLPGIGLAVGLLAVALYGLSVIIPGYALIGLLIDPGEQYLRRAGVMLLGVLAFVALAGIPILGAVVWAAAVAAGSGAMFFAYTDGRQRRPAAKPLPVMEAEKLPPPMEVTAAPPPIEAPAPVETKAPSVAKPVRKQRK